MTGFDKKEKLYNHRKNIHQNLPINLVPNNYQNVQQRRPGPGTKRYKGQRSCRTTRSNSRSTSSWSTSKGQQYCEGRRRCQDEKGD